jgi:hypothetical protein
MNAAALAMAATTRTPATTRAETAARCSETGARLGRGTPTARRGERLQMREQLGGALPAIGRILGQARHDDALHVGWHRRADGANRPGVAVTWAASTCCADAP